MSKTFYMAVTVLAVCSAFIFAAMGQDLVVQKDREIKALENLVRIKQEWIDACPAWRDPKTGQFTTEMMK